RSTFVSGRARQPRSGKQVLNPFASVRSVESSARLGIALFKYGGPKMNCSPIRSVRTGVVLMAVIAVAETGYAQPATEPAAVVPFKIQVPDTELADLKRRLAQARFADEFPGEGWDYGTHLVYLQGLVKYWRDKYDWRVQEKRLNTFDQFKTNIDGVDIHFIHQRSKNPNAMPLLLLNGWPSSIIEYEKVIGPLTDPVAYGGRDLDSFHVVIPSMPGFGFSGKPRERGYNPERIARMWVQLMARLG